MTCLCVGVLVCLFVRSFVCLRVCLLAWLFPSLCVYSYLFLLVLRSCACSFVRLLVCVACVFSCMPFPLHVRFVLDALFCLVLCLWGLCVCLLICLIVRSFACLLLGFLACSLVSLFV